MFTGIIQSLGSLLETRSYHQGLEVFIETSLVSKLQLGDSIAVNGCCLTVMKLWSNAFAADVSRETLQVTTLKQWQIGQQVNLEKALCVGDALGGHYVSGHVDGMGEVLARHDDARSVRMRISVPAILARYVAKKGSIAVDGVSLTVNEVGDESIHSWFEVNLVPHTLAVTILNNYRVGTVVNLEIDIIARYFERMHQTETTQ